MCYSILQEDYRNGGWNARDVFRTLSRNEHGAVVKIINGFHLMTFFAKRSILDPLQGAKYASEYYIALRKLNILQK